RLDGGEPQPDRRDLAQGRGAADQHVGERSDDLRGRRTRELDELGREPTLVDEHEPIVVPAERGAEPGRRSLGRIGHLRSNDGHVSGASIARAEGILAPEEHARCLGRRPLELAGHAHDGRRGVYDLVRERAEEPPAGVVHRAWLGLGGGGCARALGWIGCRRLGHRVSLARVVGQYLMTLVTRRPCSRSRPLRKSSSTRNASPTTSTWRRSTSSIVPPTVPPVARRSSTMSTRWPSEIASRWISRVFEPYSSAYSTVTVSAGSLPSFRTGTRPARSW